MLKELIKRFKNRPGLFWHVHHDMLYEWCYDPQERIDFIKARKPRHERKARLKAMRRVKGAPRKLVIAAKKKYKARIAWINIRDDYHADRSNNMYKARGEASVLDDIARHAYFDLKATYVQVMNVLHSKECPDCSWDGRVLELPRSKYFR